MVSEASEAVLAALRGCSMEDAGYELRRIHILGTTVNKGGMKVHR
jgi:hypothetical protein